MTLPLSDITCTGKTGLIGFFFMAKQKSLALFEQYFHDESKISSIGHLLSTGRRTKKYIEGEAESKILENQLSSQNIFPG